MKELLKGHHISFRIAWSGLWWALTTQPNFRVHSVLSIFVLTLGVFLKLSNIEMIILVFTIVLGFSAEMINTSIEAMTDLISKEYSREAKIAKDVSAGMMLTVAIGATIVGVVIFLPHFFR